MSSRHGLEQNTAEHPQGRVRNRVDKLKELLVADPGDPRT